MLIGVSKAREAAEVLGLVLEDLTEPALRQAYRNAARLHHPDTAAHYDAAKWARISWALEVLTRWLATNHAAPAATPPEELKDCRACGGTGRIALRSTVRRFGGKAATVMCVMCNGTGKLPEPQERQE